MTGAQRDTRNALVAAAAATAVGTFAIWVLYQIMRLAFDDVWTFGAIIFVTLVALVAAFVTLAMHRMRGNPPLLRR